ncbi:TonB-dependent receptor [Escherichia coli]|nr:TonB-dependent receptor [Escherichia coli]
MKTASPSKATAYIGWAPDPWSLRVQSTTSFDVSDAQGYKVDGYTTVDLLGSYQLPVGTLSFSIENLFDRDYTTVWGQRTTVLQPVTAQRHCTTTKAGRTFGLNYSVLF